jgi:Mor family transcriptional regulator
MSKDWVAKIAAEISIEELPESYQAVAEIIGKDSTLKLAHHLGGAAFYYRKIDAMLLYKRDELIRQEFNGINTRELARDYDLSERQVRNILQSKPLIQPGLFDHDEK